MILKATIKCTCGCTYELVSCKSHDEVKCPNCLRPFTESDKLITILKTFDSINLEPEETNPFISFSLSKEELTLNTLTIFTDDKSTNYEDDKK